ncbi:hypothetical protein G6F32_013627 [Rhizopus arrhizus]|nr:hypothetical protein G6F32_013627 [Rhizopus arrhizus]
MAGRQSAQTTQRHHGGDGARLDEVPQVLHRIAERDAAAGVDHRLLGRCQRGNGFGDGDLGRGRRRLDAARHVRRQMAGIGQLHVLGQVDQHRAGPALAGDTERIGDHARQVIDTAHQPAVLDARQGQAEHIQLLEGVGAQQRRGDLAGDADHRHRIQHRIGDAGDQVRGARAGSSHADADLAAGAGEAIGGQRSALLMAHQDVLQRRIHQRVVERHDGAAGIAEQRADAFGFQRLGQPARAIGRRAAVCRRVHGGPLQRGWGRAAWLRGLSLQPDHLGAHSAGPLRTRPPSSW